MPERRRRSDSDGWTVETAMEHIESLLEEMDRRYQERFEAQERALEKAQDDARAVSSRQLTILSIIAVLAGSIVYIWNPLHH